jgi:hypothetical protein
MRDEYNLHDIYFRGNQHFLIHNHLVVSRIRPWFDVLFEVKRKKILIVEMMNKISFIYC